MVRCEEGNEMVARNGVSFAPCAFTCIGFLPSGRRKEAIRTADSSENSPCGSISLQIPWLLWGVHAFLPSLPSWQVRLAWVNTQWCWINTWHGQDCGPHGWPALEFAIEKIHFYFETILDLQKRCRDHGSPPPQHCILLSDKILPNHQLYHQPIYLPRCRLHLNLRLWLSTVKRI